MKDKRVIGAAGEHYVLSRLLSRGILAAKAPDGVALIDIVVHQPQPDGALTFAVAIQVKTRTGKGAAWHMGKKHEDHAEPWLYYAFVDFGPLDAVVYVIPSAKVAKLVHDQHAIWLATPGKNGQAHKDNDLRRLGPSWPFEVPGGEEGWMDQYREAWHLLNVRPVDLESTDTLDEL